jgi:hypothetical protein
MSEDWMISRNQTLGDHLEFTGTAQSCRPLLPEMNSLITHGLQSLI